MAYRQTEKTRKRNEARRRQILDAARHLFSQQGYTETTMNQIVKEAGTSIGNCYFYFKNKEALLMASVKEIIEHIWSHADDNLTPGTPGVIRLASILYHVAISMMDDDETAYLLTIGNSITAVRTAIFEDFYIRIRTLIEQDPRLHRGGNPELDLYAAHGAIMSVIERKRSGTIAYTTEELALFLVRWNLRALTITAEELKEATEHLGLNDENQ